jgi:3-hydroxyisobutyrate dehydrogenase-like beta-hydroxyacid dehydrogenase
MADAEEREPTTGAVGMIGLGEIGGHAARALSRAGWTVFGHDVRPEAFDQFPEAEPTATVRDLADASQTVMVAVYDDQQLRDVLAGAEGILTASAPPATVCVLSTVTLGTLRWGAGAAAEHGMQLIDCGVTGGTGLRKTGKIVVFAGGSAEALAAARPPLEAFADPLLHMGALGTGMQAKLARNLMHYSGWYAAWEAARIAVACGVDIDNLIEGHRISNLRSSGGGTSLLSRGIRPRQAPESIDEASRRERLDMAEFARKDLDYALELAAELGISLPGAELALERIQLVVGLAEEPRDTGSR